MSKNKIAALILLFLIPGCVFASFGEAVSPKANILFDIFSLPVTNSMITTWVISLFIILIARFMIGKNAVVPPHESPICHDDYR